jgi:hypothetical protein
MVRRAAFILLASVLLTAIAGVAPAAAASEPAEFQWVLVGHEGHPNMATASNGDIIEMTGEGTLSVHPKSATGGGRFTHLAPDGVTVRGEGDYEAVDLLSFKSYGDGTPQGVPEGFGGLAIIRVALHPDGTDVVFEGNLQIDCLLGTPPAGAKEGIRLSVPGINFNKEAGGDTVFFAVE